MARKRSKSLDGSPLPIPSEPKTIKLTVIQKCFICQKELLDCPLRKGKPSSIANLIEAAKSRQDDCFRRLHLEGVDNVSVNDIVWHAMLSVTRRTQVNKISDMLLVQLPLKRMKRRLLKADKPSGRLHDLHPISMELTCLNASSVRRKLTRKSQS